MPNNSLQPAFEAAVTLSVAVMNFRIENYTLKGEVHVTNATLHVVSSNIGPLSDDEMQSVGFSYFA